jgi:hypothetical protein
MKTLLFSMVFYLLGIAGMLFFRPRLMFHRDGRWKEFGLEDGTMFPFWLFCIVWAIVSYVLARLIIVDVVTAPFAAAAAVSPMLPLDENSIPNLNETIGKHRRKNATVPASAAAPVPVPAQEMKPGYYRLNAASMEKGIPRYVYVGPEEPED